jgi:aspartate 1-decarboxylase
VIVRERGRILEVLIRCEWHRRIVTQAPLHFSSSIPLRISTCERSGAEPLVDLQVVRQIDQSENLLD